MSLQPRVQPAAMCGNHEGFGLIAGKRDDTL